MNEQAIEMLLQQVNKISLEIANLRQFLLVAKDKLKK